jgi:hypothetical protein
MSGVRRPRGAGPAADGRAGRPLAVRRRLGPRDMALLRAAALLLVAFAAYLPAFSAGIVWDDYEALFESPAIRDQAGLAAIWTGASTVDYQPITNTLRWFQWRWWGHQYVGYHATNIVLHGLAAVLVWRVLAAWGVGGAWWAALFFALHPLCVASVAWITQLKSLLAQVFYLAACLPFIRFARTSRRRWFALSCGFFILALLSKGSVVGLPVALTLVLWWRREWNKHTAGACALMLLPALVVSALTIWFQGHRTVANPAVPPDLVSMRLARVGWAVWFNLGAALWPARLALIYPRWSIDGTNPLHWMPDAALIALFGVSWRFRRTWGRPVFAALGAYVALLAPMLGLFWMSFHQYSFVHDPWQYAALPAFLALAAGAARVGYDRLRQALRPLVAGAAAVLALLFGLLTYAESAIYHSDLTLWLAAVERNPKAWVAHLNLGTAIDAEGGPRAEALRHFTEALRLFPASASAWYNVGLMHKKDGRYEPAIEAFRQALRFQPDLEVARLKLAECEQALKDRGPTIRGGGF